MTIKVNKKTTFLPIKRLDPTKRTTTGRLELAREMNDKLLDSVMKNMNERKEVPILKFFDLIQKITGKRIKISGSGTKYDSKGTLFHLNLGFSGKQSGYQFDFPMQLWDRGLSMPKLRQTFKLSQELFTEIINPKFYTRDLAIRKKTLPVNSWNFLNRKLDTRNKLTKEELQEFLKSQSLEKRINTLQFFRYELLKSQNTDTFDKYLMKKLNKDPRFDGKFSKSSISDNRHHYQNKIAMLNEELGKTLQQARAENKTKISANK